ncbi:MAG: aminomethyl-transferring glycine dehydrogenase subunit GcvPA [Xanthomonadales bacterium]|nr:aminomethyl-transferring glycine dehydrogenase subunit GcvPA [Xanthomonadales bacterium]
MPFIPHTESDVREMLKVIGVDAIDDLFDEIPESLKIEDLDLPDGQSEMAVTREMKSRAARDGTALCFAGAGAYEHHIPAAVWQITTRGEFYSAYTPYQAEASQGTLQLIYEYQTMMAKLTAMEVSNASLYDGASALAEAVLMAVRANRKSKSRRILVPETLNPAYRRVMEALLAPQEIELISLPVSDTGTTDPALLDQYADQDITAVVVAQPNFFGALEPVDELTDRAHGLGALSIGVINPMSLAILEPPGHWGEAGADIVCGDGQPLGVPLSSGGPYFGILCCKQAFVRQMPGRLVGRTTDLDGKPGYTLTLQAREQHIRRAKATSNICTNQGLLVTAATIYMALLGPRGLEEVAAMSHRNTVKLRDALAALDGVSIRFDAPVFHEVAVELPVPASEVIEKLAEQNFVAGYDLGRDYPGMENCLLVCVTETKTEADIEGFVGAVADAIA